MKNNSTVFQCIFVVLKYSKTLSYIVGVHIFTVHAYFLSSLKIFLYNLSPKTILISTVQYTFLLTPFPFPNKKIYSISAHNPFASTVLQYEYWVYIHMVGTPSSYQKIYIHPVDTSSPQKRFFIHQVAPVSQNGSMSNL